MPTEDSTASSKLPSEIIVATTTSAAVFLYHGDFLTDFSVGGSCSRVASAWVKQVKSHIPNAGLRGRI
ncbi:MAG: hypothetical protein ABSA50_12030 [Candidatus Bathyarchaeia archaeon]